MLSRDTDTSFLSVQLHTNLFSHWEVDFQSTTWAWAWELDILNFSSLHFSSGFNFLQKMRGYR